MHLRAAPQHSLAAAQPDALSHSPADWPEVIRQIAGGSNFLLDEDYESAARASAGFTELRPRMFFGAARRPRIWKSLSLLLST